MSMTVQALVEELNACEILREAIRRGSMIYQFDLKIEVARYYRLAWDEVNLPYAEWEALRAKYLAERDSYAA